MTLSLDQKVDNFSRFLQEAAEKIGCVFYEDSGEGHDLETDTLYLEDVGGWLAPIGTPENEAKCDENYRFAEWRQNNNGQIVIEFVQYAS